jgi:hypothetical protein
MKYTKPWTTDDQVATDDWHIWLAINALGGLEYQLLYWADRIELEFFDHDRADEFAQEFGL